jgi:hypothetical protein
MFELCILSHPPKKKENEKKAQDTSRKHVLLMTGLAGGVS